MRKLRVIDTSILCVWLQVPGFDHCSPTDDLWDNNRITKELIDAEKNGEEFILPLAVIIETGNHISQSKGDRYNTAQRLIDCILKTANDQSPWVYVGAQPNFWSAERLPQLAQEWLEHVTAQSSMGDISIKQVADYYAKTGAEVTIFTGDSGLKSFQPATLELAPRRRK
jgi:hypothetical protein